MRFDARLITRFSVLAGSLSIASTAKAAPVAPSSLLRVPAHAGHPELAVGFDAKGSLRAAVCPTPGCAIDNGTVLAVPSAIVERRAQATLEAVAIGDHRSIIHVRVPSDNPSVAFQALVGAKSGQAQAEIIFQGMTGLVEGEEGLRHGPTVEISETIDDAQTRRIVVGEQREELTLCGRPAVLSPKMLVPKDLALKPAKVQRLSAEERERATRLIAEPNAESSPAATNQPTETKSGAASEGAAVATKPTGGQASLLRAIGATSAIGWPASLTDGNVETTWAENRGGAGRGEFVSFRAPSDVPLQSFHFVVRPITREIKNGVGPEQLWLATDKQLYLVSFPTDPWKAPGVTWKVALPSPVNTSCVALVTESAYGEKPHSEVTLAEVTARSEFTNASIDNLVGALAGGGPRAEAAGTVLAGLGPEAFAAVAKAFNQFDEGGRRVSLDVLDHAPCADASPIYVQALLSKIEAHRMHAIDRLRRCATATVPAIERALTESKLSSLRPVCELLAEVAPDKAIELLVPRLVGPPRTRRMLREVIGKSARSPKAKDAIINQIARNDLPAEATVDLLRALGKQLTDYSEPAAAAIERLLLANADFRTKFLLLAPAHLVCDKHPGLKTALSSLIQSEPNPQLRAQAVHGIIHHELFASDLYRALDDPEVRVRHAAAENLAEYKVAQTIQALRKRLKQDDWPLVRVAAAESLASQPADAEADKALIEALDDDSWQVKSAVADTVAARKIATAGEPLLDLFTNKKERFEVRIAAARALGDVCYDAAVDKLTDSAKTLRTPGSDPRERAVASTALDALAKLHPRDLANRLSPLLSGKDTPAGTKQAAQAALAAQPHCQAPAALTTARVGDR